MRHLHDQNINNINNYTWSDSVLQMAVNNEERKSLDESQLCLSAGNLTDLSVWPHEAVLLLLEKFRNKRHLLKIPTVKKMDVWQLIAKEINKEGWGFSAQACFKKWDNLKNRYKIITERHKATGIGGTRWAYLGVMTDILQEDTSMTAPVINSSLNGIKVYARSKAGESDEENGSAVPTAGWSFQETASPDQPRTSPCVLSGYAETPPRKGKKRKREEPPTWLKEFLEKTSQAIDRLTDVVAERNMLLKQLIEKL